MLCNRRVVFTLYLFLAVAFPLPAKLVELKTIIPDVHLDIRYATNNNFMGVPVYKSARCFLEEDAARALTKVQAELKKQGLALKVFDGYRPFSVQEDFWTMWLPIAKKRGIKKPSDYVAEPKRDAKGAPIKGSKHNRGGAIDLTIIDSKTGKELEMPSEFDDFTAKAHCDAAAYAKMTPEAAKNCRLLADIMVAHGFLVYEPEWWHFNWHGWATYPLHTEIFEEPS